MPPSIGRMVDREFTASDALQSLRIALHPLRQRLQRELACDIVPSRRVADPVATLSQHFGRLPHLAERLAQSVNDMGIEVAANPHASAEDVRRAVDRLTDCVDDLIAGCREACSLRADARAMEMPRLLGGVYMHVLAETAQWLQRLVQAIADPTAAIAHQRPSCADAPKIRVTLKLRAANKTAATSAGR